MSVESLFSASVLTVGLGNEFKTLAYIDASVTGTLEAPHNVNANQYIGVLRPIPGAAVVADGAALTRSFYAADGGLVYDHPPTNDWNAVSLRNGLYQPSMYWYRELTPGVGEVYIPANTNTIRLTWRPGANVEAAIFYRDTSYVPPPPPVGNPPPPCPPRPPWPYVPPSVSAKQGPFGVLRGTRR